MRYLLLPFVIIKNLFVIFYEDVIVRIGVITFTVVVLVLAMLGGGWWYWQHRNVSDHPLDRITLAQAAKEGQATTHKLLVQIQKPKNSSGQSSDSFERGDIVLIKDKDHQFSQAEKEGFLVLKMDITDKQAEVLVRALERRGREKDAAGKPVSEQVKRRKYAINLSKINIDDDIQQGRELEQIFKWDIVVQKEL